ncbi:DUF2441 domain-containing protein [Niallia circulans]|uniref:DUF2441 domain-containing protein n=1 Tax=Niallia circulans TaxID=1397 RepID=UPI00397E2524
MRFYHLDRANTLTLEKDSNIGLIPIESLHLDKILENNLREKFPEGLSQHGISYLLGSNNKENIITEWFLEYERKIGFINQPSRFQSIFAFKELDDIQEFIKYVKYEGNNSIVYELESENYFKGDMRILGSQSSPLTQSLTSQLYWQGKSIKELRDDFNIKPLWEYLLVPPVKVINKFFL